MDNEFKKIIEEFVYQEALKRENIPAEQQQLARDQMNSILAKLDVLEDIEVPEGLVERTADYIDQAAQSRLVLQEVRGKLDEPIDREHPLAWVLGNMRNIIAAAAVLALVFLVSRPALNLSRNRSQRIQCASNLHRMGEAFALYASDNNGFMPYVATGPEIKPWQPGPGEQSRGANTRSLYLLIKNGHIQPAALICPGRDVQNIRDIAPQQIQQASDLPSGYPMGFSIHVMGRRDRLDRAAMTLIMADKNPLFDNGQVSSRNELDITKVARRMLEMNSANHHQQGQNLLRRDLSVDFAVSRMMPVSNDDIYTIQGTRHYDGTQMPGPHDEFLP